MIERMCCCLACLTVVKLHAEKASLKRSRAGFCLLNIFPHTPFSFEGTLTHISSMYTDTFRSNGAVNYMKSTLTQIPRKSINEISN